MSSAAAAEAERVRESIRVHQSAGRALLYTLIGVDDIEVAAEGSWIHGASGRRYLDLGSFSVFLLGHRPPAVVDAVRRQLEITPGTSRSLPSAIVADAAADLAAVAPPGLDKVMLLNSGAEAVEAAMKLARATTGRSPIAHLEHSFHGKTLGALSITDAQLFQGPAGPLLSDIVRMPRDDAAAADERIRATEPAAVFVEPVQGEGGAFEVDPAFLARLRAVCDEVGSLLVFDEIQCGLGRTGTLWAAAGNPSPDILLTGKALGGGVIPVSAVVATATAFGPYDRDPLLHSSTFGGNPLAAAALRATVEVIREDRVPERCARLGATFRELLEDLVAEHPELFTEVTGRGLLLGLHCTRPDVSGELIRASHLRSVLLTPCLTTPEVVRVTPPSTVQPEDIEFARRALQEAARAVRAECLPEPSPSRP